LKRVGGSGRLRLTGGSPLEPPRRRFRVVQALRRTLKALPWLLLAATRWAAADPPSASLAYEGAPLPGGGIPILPQRLTRLHFARLRNTPRAALEIPLDSQWQTSRPVAVAVEDGALKARSRGRGIFLTRPFRVDAARFNTLRVRMRVNRGAKCAFSWQSDIEPYLNGNPGVDVPLFPGDEFHTYAFPLDASSAPTWCGNIKRIRFLASDQPSEAVIEAMELAYEPPKGPHRLTIHSETHEALLGAQAPWPVTVPPAGVLETHIGMGPRAWERRVADGVRFRVLLDAEDTRGVVLLERELRPRDVEADRRWMPCRADLSPYAGQEVVIRLEVDGLTSPSFDYAYWGNPMVYSRQAASDATPVFLISCDTLRADHVSCYGYERETTPHLDAFANEAVLFKSVIAPEVWTLSSHMTMLTGLYPKRHGVTHSANLAEESVTLAETLSDAGYLTAGHVGHCWWLLPSRGFAQGFDEYTMPPREDNFRDVFAVHTVAQDWLGTHPLPNVFTFLHNYDIHSKFAEGGYDAPYYPPGPEFLHFAKAFPDPPSFARDGGNRWRASGLLGAVRHYGFEITEEERDYIVALYDDCIRAVDQAIHDFFEELRALGLYERALIIVTADHGEEFGEHGWYLHDQIYEECCRVPLLIKFPHGRFAGRRVADMVELTDLFPTILRVLGIESSVPTDGHDLVALLEGRAEPKRFVYTTKSHILRYAVATPTWKLHRANRAEPFELYNLVEDPREERNRYEDVPQIAAELRDALEGFFAPSTEGWHFHFIGGALDSRVRLTFRTDEPLANAELLYAKPLAPNLDTMTLMENGDSVTADLALTSADRDEILARPFSSRQKGFVSVACTRELTTIVDGAASHPARVYREVLDPVASEFAKPDEESLRKGQAPKLFIWYEAPSVERTRAEELPENAVEHLRGIGYLD